MASREDIAYEINSLAAHCRPPLMASDERAAWTVDWITDLQDFPIEAIRDAFRQWRRSGSTKFPTPGQLLPIIRAAAPGDTQGERIQAWRPLSDAEYDGLSVRDKIRHQLILAHEARLKAGPMFRNTSSGMPITKASGKHLTPEEMPDIWRRWNDIAEQHQAEAKRLRGFVRPQAVAAE